MSFVIDGRGGRTSSKVINSMRGLSDQIQIETDGGQGDLIGHTVQIKTGGMTIGNDTFDCEFDIPFDDDTEANEAELILYNLSDGTIQNIRKDAPVTVTAGYGDNTGIIFSGFISKVRTYFSELDKVTEIYALDSMDLKEREIESTSYAPGTTASFILKDLIGKVGLPLAVFSPKRDFVYQDGTTADGGLMENIRKQAEVCGVSAYICKSQIYVRHITEGDALLFNLSSDTGLLSLSEFEEEQTAEDFVDTVHGYEMTMLLQHQVTTASMLNVRSRNVTGTYRVREGNHTYDGTDFLTKVKAIECPPAPPAATEAPKETGVPDLSGYSGVSIVDGLKSVGADSSMTYRKMIAEKLGISGYSGTAAQNLEMLRKLGAKVG